MANLPGPLRKIAGGGMFTFRPFLVAFLFFRTLATLEKNLLFVLRAGLAPGNSIP